MKCLHFVGGNIIFQKLSHNKNNKNCDKLFTFPRFCVCVCVPIHLCLCVCLGASICVCELALFGLAYQGKHIVYRFIIECNSLKAFWPLGKSNFIVGFSERWYFGLCWNLILIIELSYLERFWFLLEDSLEDIFLHSEIFEFS